MNGEEKDGTTGRTGASVPRRPQGQRGIALLLVLWLLALLSVMALSFSGTARIQGHIAHNLYENAKARWLADAGVRLAVRRLWLSGSGEPPTPTESITPFCRFGSGHLAVNIQNVSGLIDLNAAHPATLANLFAVAGMEETEARRLAAAIADFRDQDGRKRPEGAEAEDYIGAGLLHRPKNAEFKAVEELEQVLHMPPELVRRTRTALTVHCGRPAADLRLAPPLVRRAHGDSSDDPATGNDALANKGTGVFRIEVTAKTASGARFTREAVLAVNGAPRPGYRVLRWGRLPDPELAIPGPEELPPC